MGTGQKKNNIRSSGGNHRSGAENTTEGKTYFSPGGFNCKPAGLQRRGGSPDHFERSTPSGFRGKKAERLIRMTVNPELKRTRHSWGNLFENIEEKGYTVLMACNMKAKGGKGEGEVTELTSNERGSAGNQ